MSGEQIGMSEKCEIMAYKLITYIPVVVTFGVFGFLACFYSYVSCPLCF